MPVPWIDTVYHLTQLAAVCTDTDLNFLCVLKDCYEMKIISVRRQVLREQKTVPPEETLRIRSQITWITIKFGKSQGRVIKFKMRMTSMTCDCKRSVSFRLLFYKILCVVQVASLLGQDFFLPLSSAETVTWNYGFRSGEPHVDFLDDLEYTCSRWNKRLLPKIILYLYNARDTCISYILLYYKCKQILASVTRRKPPHMFLYLYN